jgi:small subunit ribosomal protein S4e
LARKGGRRRTKRSLAPKFLKIPRKRYKFITTTSPGPHPKDWSINLLTLVRDVLKLAKIAREAKDAIKRGKIIVDGKVRKDPGFPVGLMDVIEIPSINKVYRILPVEEGLAPFEVPEEEKNVKVCIVKNKINVKNGKFQYSLHDGRNVLASEDIGLKPGDSCLIEVPSQKIVKKIPLEEGIVALVIKGQRSGKICKVIEIEPGTITREPIVKVGINGQEVELPKSTIMPIGEEKPVISLPMIKEVL